MISIGYRNAALGVLLAITVVSLVPSASAAAPRSDCADVVFYEEFDDSPVPVADFTGFANWTVLAGSVDLFIGDGGAYVDGDGSDPEPGLMVSKALISLTEGAYLVEVTVAGSRVSSSLLDSVVVSYDGVYSRTYEVPYLAPFVAYPDLFYVPSSGTTGRVMLHFSGTDGAGAHVDSVFICKVAGPAMPTPELSTLALAGAGLGAVALAGVDRLRAR